MILLQAAIGWGSTLLVMPVVILVHICIIHYIFSLVRPIYSTYTTFGKVITWIGLIALISIAVAVIPLWSAIGGFLVMILDPIKLAFIPSISLFCALLLLESKFVYDHNFKENHVQFSKKHFAYSMLIALLIFMTAMGVVAFTLKDVNIG